MTRVSVLGDLVYTMAVREKQRYKVSDFGWSKRKKELIGSLAAMQFLCQCMARPELDDALCTVIVATVPNLSPVLQKEPEFRDGFAARFRPHYMAGTPTAALSADQQNLITLAISILSRSILLLSGKHADHKDTRETIRRYLMGLHNVIRPLLPDDDRFLVSPAEGWSYAKVWLEPDFVLTLTEVPEEIEAE